VAAVAARTVEQVGARLEAEKADDSVGLPPPGLRIGELAVGPQVELVEELVPCALGVMLCVADSQRV